MTARSYDRNVYDLRPITIETDVNKYAEGSALISFGDTKVLCLCSVEERVPGFKKDSGEGWVTAEYSMLPRATSSRNSRESMKGRPGGRTLEIQRLIGRSIRSVVDFKVIDGLTFTIDCDVLQADGGTRTASITGGYVAMALACQELVKRGVLDKTPLMDTVAAVSLGVVEGELLVDLDYAEDSNADVDLNLVMTGSGNIVEVQGTAEKVAFSRGRLMEMVDHGNDAITRLMEFQKRAIYEQ
jgi:ribonuclease PH